MALFTVTTNADGEAGSETTLREAIAAANASPGLDVIEFEPDRFNRGEGSNTIRLDRAFGTLEITDSVIIDGTSVGGITITADSADNDVLTEDGWTDIQATPQADLFDNFRVMIVSGDSEETTLRNLTITGGYVWQDAPGDGPDYPFYDFDQRYSGGGIWNDAGNLNIESSSVSGNGVYVGETGQFGSGGGGIVALHPFNPFDPNAELNILRILNSSIEDNHVEGVTRIRAGSGPFAGEEYVFAGGGGGVQARFAQINSSTIANNSTNGDYAHGGGLSLNYDASIVNSTIYGNVTKGDHANGGGVSAASRLEIINTTITGNRTEGENAEGGGFAAYGDSTDDGVGNDLKRIVNSIIIGNVAERDRQGSDDLALSPHTDFFGSPIADENVFEGANIFGQTYNAQPGLTEILGPIFERSPTAVFENGGELKDNGGDVKSVKLRASPLNPAIDGSIGSAVPEDTTGRPAQDWPGQGFDNDLPGIRDLGAYELPLLTGGLPTVVEGTEGNDRLQGSDATELFRVGAGVDRVQGRLGQLDGDAIEGFGYDDALRVKRARFGPEDVTARRGSIILEIDADGDGGPDATVTLEGDYGRSAVLVDRAGRDTDVTLAKLWRGTNKRDAHNGENGGRDLMQGRGGNDRLKGRDGDDLIDGGGGKDRLWGGGGDDQIEGGGGADQMWGGAGRDVFGFGRNFGSDRIKDFDARQDALDFSEHSRVDGFKDLKIRKAGSDVKVLDGAGGQILIEDAKVRQIDRDVFDF
ncbi:MAG: hypothetical protein AAF763_03250 [Pseudomonadota bacterium]